MAFRQQPCTLGRTEPQCKSGLILDVVIEAGNPADSERLLPMLERHIVRYGEAPRQAAADGSFASRDNLRQAKAQGVRDSREPLWPGLPARSGGFEAGDESEIVGDHR